LRVTGVDRNRQFLDEFGGGPEEGSGTSEMREASSWQVYQLLNAHRYSSPQAGQGPRSLA
jgi:hypothetical protein